VAKDNRKFINAVFWIQNGRAVAGFAAGLRRLEQYVSSFFALAQQWDAGKIVGIICE